MFSRPTLDQIGSWNELGRCELITALAAHLPPTSWSGQGSSFDPNNRGPERNRAHADALIALAHRQTDPNERQRLLSIVLDGAIQPLPGRTGQPRHVGKGSTAVTRVLVVEDEESFSDALSFLLGR